MIESLSSLQSYNKVNPFIVAETENRVKIAKVEFMEHGKNAAAYLPGD